MKALRTLLLGLISFLAFLGMPDGVASPTDSLRQKYAVEKNSNKRYRIARELAVLYASRQIDSAVYFAHHSRIEAEKAENDTLLADGLYLVSAIHFYASNYDSSLWYCKQSNIMWKKLNSEGELAYNYNIMASIHQMRHEMQEAYDYYFKALKIFEKLGDKDGEGKVVNNLGSLANTRGMKEEARKFFARGLTLDPAAKDSVYSLQNMSGLLLEMQLNEEALLYIKLGITLSQRIQDQTRLGLFYKHYATYLSRNGQLDSAFIYIGQSIEYVRRSKSLQHTYTTLLRGASIGFETGQLVAVKDYLDEAWQIVATGKIEYEETHLIHNYYAEFYEALGMLDSSIVHYKEYVSIKDSILILDQTEAAEKMRAQFDAEKKEKEIALLNKDKALQDAEIARQRWMLGLGVGVLILILVLLFLVYRNNLQRKKAQKLLAKQKAQVEETAVSLREANVEVNQQKEEILAINEALETQKEELAAHNKHQTDAIRYASTIQQAVLPWEDRLNRSLAEYFIVYQPKDIVSGDFYWFSSHEDGSLFMAVADCTGHGVPGAFLSMLGITFLTEIVEREKETDPATILERLDVALRHALRQKYGENSDGMDIGIVRIFPGENFMRKVEFAGAKRPLLYSQDQKVHRLKGTPRSIGGFTRASKTPRPFETQYVTLGMGDMLYLGSDGFVDQLSPERKKLSSTRFYALLESWHTEPCATQKDELWKAFEAHRQEADFIDDITLIGIRL